MPSADKEALTIEPWALWIALSTLVLVGSVAVFTSWDHAHRTGLEAVITPTAVGDTRYVAEPGSGSGPIGLKYQGQNLEMLSEAKIRDSKLVYAGTDDSGGHTLYRPEGGQDLPKGCFYMKTAPNEFIEVTAP